MDVDDQIPVGFAWADCVDRKVAECDLMLVLKGCRPLDYPGPRRSGPRKLGIGHSSVSQRDEGREDQASAYGLSACIVASPDAPQCFLETACRATRGTLRSHGPAASL
jgi:hypothetical protein